jgi:hypothetical protein
VLVLVFTDKKKIKLLKEMGNCPIVSGDIVEIDLLEVIKLKLSKM